MLHDEGAWYNLKLVATEPRQGKANFWLSYNVEQQRWRASRDYLLLHQLPGQEGYSLELSIEDICKREYDVRNLL